MDNRQIKRIEDYCHRLNLNFMDRKDILTWLSFDRQSTDEKARAVFEKAHYRIVQLDYLPMVNQFNEYLEEEERLFCTYKGAYPNLSDGEIWAKVYKTIDKEISIDIAAAKDMSIDSWEAHNDRVHKNNTGCIILIWVIGILVVLLISFW